MDYNKSNSYMNWGDVLSPKTGTPISINPRQMRVETKMTIDELEKLDYCCKISGKTRSEIVREGIDNTYTKLCELDKK